MPRITTMKNGSTHLAYKAEHAVDLDTETITAEENYHADQLDLATLEDTRRFAVSQITEITGEVVTQ